MKQCPRCLKNIGTSNGDIHTCSPTDWARKMESRVAELEAERDHYRWLWDQHAAADKMRGGSLGLCHCIPCSDYRRAHDLLNQN